MIQHIREQISVDNMTLRPEQITNGLDFYKPTMSQLAYEKEPFTEVTFSFKNRGEQRIADYAPVDQLNRSFERIRERGWNDDELKYLHAMRNSAGDRLFSDEYINYLQESELPEVLVTLDKETNDLAIETTGPWAMNTFWETVIMSEVNEVYFENFVRANGIDLEELYEEGQRRLEEKIAILQENPGVKIIDFGTRRHFSLRWHNHVLSELKKHCPENLIGTSNVGLARDKELAPIGTFAHEMPMVYTALADARGEDVRAAHNQFLQEWFERYGEDLSVVLTDTFSTDFFFVDFSQQQAEEWRGYRQDSGDPIVFGERLITFLTEKGIDPMTKLFVPSDGLSMEKILEIYECFRGRINIADGWGTTLMNDLGIPPLNIVMKATAVYDPLINKRAETVKLSDNIGKHTGSKENIDRYKKLFGVDA